MTRFVIHRLLWFIPTLLVIYTLTFAMMHAAPGKPWETDKEMSAEAVAKFKHEYYLDRPWPVAYTLTLRDLVTLRGQSSMYYRDWNTVREILGPSFLVSTALGTLALALSLVVGVLVGIFSAVRRYTLLDHLLTGTTLLGISIPSFVVASLLLMVFSFWLQLMPAGGWGSVRQLILPAVALAAFPAAYIARLMRNSMLDVLPADFMRVAECKGLSRFRVIFSHGLKNAMLPVLSYVGPAAAGIFTGSFVVEKLFNIPGVGFHFVTSALNRDHPLILACVMLYSALLLAMNLLVDIGYGWLDPRIRYD
ncbi:MAG: ABC transporter permease [Planctomycetes bacterium]|nr:ABC transporter permease [Planctomycetota bacterium]